MPRGRSNSLGDLPARSGNPSESLPSFLGARAVTDLLLRDPANTANGDSISGARLELNLSLPQDVPEHVVAGPDSGTATQSREGSDISQDDGSEETRRIDPLPNVPATRFWNQKSLLTCGKLIC